MNQNETFTAVISFAMPLLVLGFVCSLVGGMAKMVASSSSSPKRLTRLSLEECFQKARREVEERFGKFETSPKYELRPLETRELSYCEATSPVGGVRTPIRIVIDSKAPPDVQSFALIHELLEWRDYELTKELPEEEWLKATSIAHQDYDREIARAAGAPYFTLRELERLGFYPQGYKAEHHSMWLLPEQRKELEESRIA